MIFPQLPIHTHIFLPKKYPLTSDCSSLFLVSSCKAVSNKNTSRKATKVASETAAITIKLEIVTTRAAPAFHKLFMVMGCVFDINTVHKTVQKLTFQAFY